MFEENSKKSFDGMLSNFTPPSMIVSQDGEILIQNSKIKDILGSFGIDPIRHIKEIDESFNSDLHLCGEFYSSTLKMSGLRCKVASPENKTYFLYVFNQYIKEELLIESLIEHIDEVVVIFDENGKIQKMNSVCDEILPFTRAEVIGKDIYELMDSGEVSEPVIIKMLEAKKKVYKNIIYPSGKMIAYTAIPLFDSDENIKGGVLTGRDISRIAKLDIVKRYDENDNIENEEVQEAKEYVSVSKEMKKVKKIILRAARSDSSIFITGETGVGKEVVARYIHNNSSRSEKPFIAVNCGAIPAELIESELFGYEEGAFSGARKRGKEGIVELVDGGTLFLDEIGELPYDMQKKLLRVIQENEVTRVGGLKPKKIDVRYVSATNITSEELHNPKKFRQDLYFRLSVIPIGVPPLRSRKDDIVPMCNHFLEIFNEKYQRNIRITKKVGDILTNNPWHGNVRELKNLVERLVVLSNKDLVGEDQLQILMNLDNMMQENEIVNNRNDANIHEFQEVLRDPITINADITLNEAIKYIEQKMIKDAIDKYGSIQKAASAIGIDPSTIHRKIKSGQIEI